MTALTELPAGKYKKVESLIGDEYPNLAFVFGVLEGKLPGRVYVRNGDADVRTALVVTDSPFCFLLGSASEDMQHEVLNLLRVRRGAKLIYPKGVPVCDELSGRHFEKVTRCHFTLPNPRSALPEIETPSGYSLHRIDSKNFDKLNWKDAVLGIFGSSQRYLEQGYGFCLLHDGQVVSETHGVVGSKYVELGIHTHPDYRGRGLPLSIMTEAARMGHEIGLRTIVSCDRETTGTISIARRLGMRFDYSYDVARNVSP
ncbi:GNAT family N-acetyltransferase [Streptomyces sp. NPDC060085]|uniref:GNAT family N-acetyltransferase n=1 Tax=Streptomyces sp. NPDC060085 TaxID=3347054 RepID=UPI003660A7DC